jgi:hypothetical protein
MHRPVSGTNLQETGSFCINYITNTSVLNKISANCKLVSGLVDFQPLTFQMQNVFKAGTLALIIHDELDTFLARICKDTEHSSWESLIP